MGKENKMHVFMVARGGIGKAQLKLNRKYDADLVHLAVGWLMQEQAQRDEKQPPITKLEMKVNS
jgi:hypothetical protein